MRCLKNRQLKGKIEKIPLKKLNIQIPFKPNIYKGLRLHQPKRCECCKTVVQLGFAGASMQLWPKLTQTVVQPWFAIALLKIAYFLGNVWYVYKKVL